jgi:CRP-like cAMP-binding protein
MSEHNLQSVAFPTLDETEINQLAGCSHAVPKLFRDGQTLFAAGDRNMNFFVVRSGSVKRVASAVGEGAMAVQFVHEHLKHM